MNAWKMVLKTGAGIPESPEMQALIKAGNYPDSKYVREGIMKLESALGTLEQGDFPLLHHWADGQYGREIFIRAGSLLVGKIHKHSHLNIISMGECTVITEFGLSRIKAPKTFVSQPGTKRALYAHTDTIWTTVHVTDKTTEAEAEEEIIAKDYAEYDELAFRRNLSLAMGCPLPSDVTKNE